MKIFFALMICTLAQAEVSKEVLLRGKVGGYFTDKEVKIVDNFGQSMIIPRSAFPKGFRMEQGAEFSLEVDPSQIKEVKVAKKK